MWQWIPWHHANVEARRDVERAEQALHEVRQQWPEVRRAAASMDEHLAENGFARRIRIAMGVNEP